MDYLKFTMFFFYVAIINLVLSGLNAKFNFVVLIFDYLYISFLKMLDLNIFKSYLCLNHLYFDLITSRISYIIKLLFLVLFFNLL